MLGGCFQINAGLDAGGEAQSGAGAHALQDLPAYRSRALNVKRRGVRNAVPPWPPNGRCGPIGRLLPHTQEAPALMFLVSCLEKFGSMPRRQFESCALHEEEIAWNYIFYGAD